MKVFKMFIAVFSVTLVAAAVALFFETESRSQKLSDAKSKTEASFSDWEEQNNCAENPAPCENYTKQIDDWLVQFEAYKERKEASPEFRYYSFLKELDESLLPDLNAGGLASLVIICVIILIIVFLILHLVTTSSKRSPFVVKTASKKTDDKNIDKPANKPADKPYNNPTDKPADKQTDKPDDNPTDKPDNKQTDESDDKSDDKQDNKPVEEAKKIKKLKKLKKSLKKSINQSDQSPKEDKAVEKVATPEPPPQVMAQDIESRLEPEPVRAQNFMPRQLKSEDAQLMLHKAAECAESEPMQAISYLEQAIEGSLGSKLLAPVLLLCGTLRLKNKIGAEEGKAQLEKIIAEQPDSVEAQKAKAAIEAFV